MRTIIVLIGFCMITACATSANSVKAPVMINTVPATARPATAGLDRVMGKDARTLVTLFGAADQDIQEVTGRKLQFETRSCILDTYLYAAAPGREPLVTFAEARQPDGKDADAAACIAAMAKRK